MAKVQITGLKKLQMKLKKTADKMQPATLVVGFFENSKYLDSDVTALDVAVYNEFGDPAHNRPPRPFMQQTKQKYKSSWTPMLLKFLQQTNGDVNKAMKLLGQVIQGQIQMTISAGGFAPNAPATIAKKGKASVLRDTGHMLQSVTYDVD